MAEHYENLSGPMALALKVRVDSAIRGRYHFACQNIALLIRVPEMTDAENDIREAAAIQVVADAFEKSLDNVAEDVEKFRRAVRYENGSVTVSSKG